VQAQTDLEILGPDEPVRIKTGSGGRPRVNRELAKNFIKAGYKPGPIADYMNCSKKTITRIKKELFENGELDPEEEYKRLYISEADFDKECIKSTGISFYEWLKNRSNEYKFLFKFTRRVWERVWDKPSLIIVKDTNHPLGDEICVRYLNVFGNDRTRIRYRKKNIRYFFRFIGRIDLCDRHLSMNRSRDPIPVRRIPQLPMLDFPLKIQDAIDNLYQSYGSEMATLIKFKIVSQMRTGKRKEGRGIFGLVKGTSSVSHLYFSDENHYCSQVLEKNNEVWSINWIPRPVREELFDLYKKRNDGEYIFQINYRRALSEWSEVSTKNVGISLLLHDLRKVSITWLFVMGVPLEIATELNVGWKDLNTPKRHYLHMRGLLKKSNREKYKANIPDWFKEGLEEYT
jgi:hypothetical protein